MPPLKLRSCEIMKATESQDIWGHISRLAIGYGILVVLVGRTHSTILTRETPPPPWGVIYDEAPSHP